VTSQGSVYSQFKRALLLAYAGLQPDELRALRWHMIGERVLSVPDGKTGDRPVKLLAPLRRTSRSGG
jgi:hypothetical protein